MEQAGFDAETALAQEYAALFHGVGHQSLAKDYWSAFAARDHEDPDSPKALCLSGGGIRSATFCLGLMQGLAKTIKPAGGSHFDQFHYLSTVSGGGYIGSWLSRWMAGDPIPQDEQSLGGKTSSSDKAEPDTVPERMPRTAKDALIETPDKMADPDHPIRRLRSFSNYLAPNWGFTLDGITLATIFIRNLLYNLLLWVPLLLFAAILPRLLIALVDRYWSVSAVQAKGAGLLEFLFGPRIDSVEIAAFGFPLVCLAVWALGALTILALSRWTNEQTRETVARGTALVLQAGLLFFLVFLLFIYVPILALSAGDMIKEKATVDAKWAALFSGGIVSITALMGFWSRYGPNLRKTAAGFIAALGSRLLDFLALVTILILAFALALSLEIALHGAMNAKSGDLADSFYAHLKENSHHLLSGQDRTWHLYWPAIYAAGLALIAGLMSYFVAVNRYSLHALYGNRLVRAYLGSARAKREPSTFTDFDADDNIAMSQLAVRSKGTGAIQRPFHVLNLTLNLTRAVGQRRDWQERKGASFVATPLHCGANVQNVGFIASDSYGGEWGMTLARAMTISGAAASPNMGYHSSPLVALIMTILNIRLGWWSPNPSQWEVQDRNEKESWRRWLRQPRDGSEPGFGLWYALNEALFGVSNKSNWLYLSDGGHFDNLGLYEMVRRRCRRIVVVDAGCDGKFQYADLHGTVRRISVDLAVPIDLPSILPGQDGIGRSSRILVGRIRYTALGDGYPDGELILVKPVLLGNEPPALAAYASASRRGGHTFPHHSTADQFFTETQFESYRRLGELSADDLISCLGRDGKKASEGDVRLFPAKLGPVVPEPPAAMLSGKDAVLSNMDNMSAGKLAAAAVSAIAALGIVTGIGHSLSIKLIDGIVPPPPIGHIDIALGDKDRALINGGIAIRTDKEAIKAITNLQLAIAALAEQGKKPVVDGDTNIVLNATYIAAIEKLTKTINDYLNRPASPVVVKIDATDLADIKKLIGDNHRELLGDKDADLTHIIARLEAIKRSIEATGPRRNIRGGQ